MALPYLLWSLFLKKGGKRGEVRFASLCYPHRFSLPKKALRGQRPELLSSARFDRYAKKSPLRGHLFPFFILTFF
jgi:hypothetical protein